MIQQVLLVQRSATSSPPLVPKHFYGPSTACLQPQDLSASSSSRLDSVMLLMGGNPPHVLYPNSVQKIISSHSGPNQADPTKSINSQCSETFLFPRIFYQIPYEQNTQFLELVGVHLPAPFSCLRSLRHVHSS